MLVLNELSQLVYVVVFLKNYCDNGMWQILLILLDRWDRHREVKWIA